MTRILLRLLACLLVALALPAAAQQPAPAAPATRPAAPPALTPQQAQQALEVLRDPQRRAEILAVLEALARAAPAAVRPAPGGAPATGGSQVEGGTASDPPPAAQAVPPAPAAAPSAPLAPDSVGAQVIGGLYERLVTLGEDFVELVRTVTSFPLIVLWLVQLAADPDRQALLRDTVWQLAAVMGGGLAAELLVGRLLRRLRTRLAARVPAQPAPADHLPPVPANSVTPVAARLEKQARQSDRVWRGMGRLGLWLRRVPFGLAALALDLLPLLAMIAVAYVLLKGGMGKQPTPQLVILATLNAYLLYRLVAGGVRMLLAPGDARLRLVPMGDVMASYVDRWARRSAAVGIFGYTFIEAGLQFGLYRLAYGSLVKLLVLVLAGFLVVMILQQRETVAARIRPAEGAPGLVARIRAMIAPVWHIVAAVYVGALWVVLALDLPDGFLRVLQLSVVTAVVLVLARVLLLLALAGLHRLLCPPESAPGTSPAAPAGMAGRLVSYQPVLDAVLRMAFAIATTLALLEVWGVAAVSWLLRAELGGRLLGMLGSIAFTIALAVGVWEMVNLAIDRHLARLAASAQAARSARLRTLLPMFRTALMVAILVVVVLTVLSEIGLNITPLLAGASVFGVALGFGSQRLVQDIITGLFLLLENTMQVGDVVTLGGLTGTVENLSVRTIRLRAMDGSMHIVPFSAVTTVTNQTRDFGYAVMDITIGLGEDPEQIGGLLRDVAGAMRREAKWAATLNGDLEVLGIDRFVDKGLVLRARIRTTPNQRWAVARELNLRIKQRFDELAVDSPMSAPHAGDASG
jgi:small-conductance mechanosensitive channel